MVTAMNTFLFSDRHNLLDVEIRLCPDCHRPSDGPFGVCDSCMASREAKHKEALQRERAEKRALAWSRMCHLLYRHTDWNHPGLSPVLCELAHTWWAKDNGMGLGIYGPTGVGKTRAVWEILRRHHFSGRSVFAATAQQIQFAVGDFHSDTQMDRNAARKLIRDCKGAGILFVDDIGKERSTAAVAAVLHDIVETRISHKLPILWTSEMTGEDLAQKLGDNYGHGLIRRLREFSTVIAA